MRRRSSLRLAGRGWACTAATTGGAALAALLLLGALGGPCFMIIINVANSAEPWTPSHEETSTSESG